MESPYPNGSLHSGGGTSVGGGGGGVLQPEQHLPCSVFTATACSTLLGGESIQLGGDIFLDQYKDVDVSSEWLSSFVEECLSSAGNYSCLPISTPTSAASSTTTTDAPAKLNHSSNQHKKTTHRNSGLPGKPRSQRKRRLPNTTPASTDDPFPRTLKNPYLIRPWPDQFNNLYDSAPQSPLQLGFSDPPLLEQAYWLADSELILPMKKPDIKEVTGREEGVRGKENNNNGGGDRLVVGDKVDQQQFQQPARRCTHCQAQKTPQWRAGPMGPKTLCNACGVRYFKSGKLLPEYRPAKSPTFVSYKHSNSHKKVLQMRMAFHYSSSPNSSSDPTVL